MSAAVQPIHLQHENLLVSVDAEKCRRDLKEFVRGAWHILEPRRTLLWNWHLDIICELLMAVTEGRIRKLIINIPPRCMKSLIVSVLWPAWEWTTEPNRRHLTISYADALASRDARKTRNVIQSAWYQERWGHKFEFAGDQNAKMRFENDATGYRIAAGMDGIATGEGGDVMILDDPHNVMQALSDVKRVRACTTYRESLVTRPEPGHGATVLVMQRLHMEDLSGIILDLDGDEVVHLCLPMEYDPERKCEINLPEFETKQGEMLPAIHFEDPRTEEGELLWNDRFDNEELDSRERSLGLYGYAGQMQQLPAPRGGGMILTERIHIIDELPDDCGGIHSVMRSWDKAGTEEGKGARSAGVKLARLHDDTWCIMHATAGRWSAGKREQRIKQTARADGRKCLIAIEQEPGSGGKESAEGTVIRLRGYQVTTVRPTGEKAVRAENFAIAVENGVVMMMRGPWNQDYLDEVANFPVGLLDYADATAQAYNLMHVGRGEGDHGYTL